MVRLFLLRHGETDWNLDRRIMGNSDIPLNQAGLEQARRFHSQLQPFPFSRVISSPILRARQTAEQIVSGFKVEVEFDSRLEEVNYGDWVGKTFQEVRAMPGYIPYFRRLDTPVAPGGETLYQVRDRSREFLQDCQKNFQDENVLVVSHADWIKSLVLDILGVSLENIWKVRIDNGSVSLLECHEKHQILVCLNQRIDLARLFATRAWF